MPSDLKKDMGMELIIDKLWYVANYYLKTVFPKHGITESKNIKMLKDFWYIFSKGYISVYVHEHGMQIMI